MTVIAFLFQSRLCLPFFPCQGYVCFQNSRKYAVYPNGTFEIYDVTQDDVAFYTCRVANSFGEMSDSASLNTTGNII